MAQHSAHRELSAWLDHNGYRHAHARAKKKKTPHPYEARKISPGNSGNSGNRVIHQEPTGRPVFAEHERDHHITTSGRRALDREQFALPPGPNEKRRGIKGRLPIDTLKRARSALARASMMHHQGHLNAGQLAEARRVVHRAWPSIEVHATP